eukprot:1523261-Rhodomonas_salina.1
MCIRDRRRRDERARRDLSGITERRPRVSHTDTLLTHTHTHTLAHTGTHWHTHTHTHTLAHTHTSACNTPAEHAPRLIRTLVPDIAYHARSSIRYASTGQRVAACSRRVAELDLGVRDRGTAPPLSPAT